MRQDVNLLQVKGELLAGDGKSRTFDDVIQDMIYYWKTGARAFLLKLWGQKNSVVAFVSSVVTPLARVRYVHIIKS
jgi:hypothetical protein